MKTYAIYTQCDHCGVYDRDPQWCALCQRPKEAKRDGKVIGPAEVPRKDNARLAAGLARRP